jgi:hypothetical protein
MSKIPWCKIEHVDWHKQLTGDSVGLSVAVVGIAVSVGAAVEGLRLGELVLDDGNNEGDSVGLRV